MNNERPQFVMAYTVVLFLVGGFALMSLASHTFFLIPLMKEDPDHEPIVIYVMHFVQAVEAILVVLCFAVGVLRAYRSRIAAPTTAALSILLIFWLPFGTAAFIYWVGWVRRREKP